MHQELSQSCRFSSMYRRAIRQPVGNGEAVVVGLARRGQGRPAPRARHRPCWGRIRQSLSDGEVVVVGFERSRKVALRQHWCLTLFCSAGMSLCGKLLIYLVGVAISTYASPLILNEVGYRKVQRLRPGAGPRRTTA